MDRAVLVQKPCEYFVRFTFQSPETDHAAISALGAGFAYSDGQGKLQSKQIFSGLDFGIHRDSRVAVVGRNGSGKSTLLRLLSQQLICTVSLEPLEAVANQPRLMIICVIVRGRSHN